MNDAKVDDGECKCDISPARTFKEINRRQTCIAPKYYFPQALRHYQLPMGEQCHQEDVSGIPKIGPQP
jgi:hypothetical protein